MQKAIKSKKFSDDTLTISKSGKVEVRSLVSRGRYVIYSYLDPKTEKESNEKQKLVLKSQDGKIKQWFIIPMSGPRSLMIEAKLKESEKKVWNEKAKKTERLI